MSEKNVGSGDKDVALLPCPFCGLGNVAEIPVPNTQGNRRFVMCRACMAEGPWSTKNTSASEGWNKAPRSATEESYLSAYDNALDRLAAALESAIASEEVLDTDPPVIKLYADKLHTLQRELASEQEHSKRLFLRLTRSSTAQAPVAWVDVHDRTCLYYEKPSQVDVMPLYASPVSATEEPIKFHWERPIERSCLPEDVILALGVAEIRLRDGGTFPIKGETWKRISEALLKYAPKYAATDGGAKV